MKLRRAWWAGAAAALAAAALLPACSRRKQAEVNPIVPSFTVSRPKAPLGSAVEVTYTWTVEPGAKKVPENYRAFVGFSDPHGVMLFEDDHVPTPPPSAWEPGKTYSYTRTKFIPIYPYVGEVDVRMGLYPYPGRGERIALKGDDAGMRSYRVAKMELLPQTENIFLVYKDGWHSPESSPQNPTLERTWTKKDALVSFKNPKKDIVVYLEADTNAKAFDQPPVLTLAVAGKTGVVVPISNSEVFLEKVRVKGQDLGNEEWVDLRLSMNQSFVPKLKGVNTHDERELGLLVYHLYVGEADKLGNVPATTVVDAGPVTLPPPASPAPALAASKGASPAKAPAGTPAALKSPDSAKTPAPKRP
jgi:hypothetical protein